MRTALLSLCLFLLAATGLQAQRGHRGDHDRRDQAKDRIQTLIQELELTDEQIAEFKTLAADTDDRRAKMEAFRSVLTEAQRAELKQLAEGRKSDKRDQLDARFQELADELDLTEDQITKLRAIQQARREGNRAARESIKNILTEEQLEKLRAMRRN